MHSSVIDGLSKKTLRFGCVAVFIIIPVSYFYMTAHVTIQLKLSQGSPVSRVSYSPDTKGKETNTDEKGPGPFVSSASSPTLETKGNKTTTDKKGHGMTWKDAPSSTIVLYNRVPKCGSRSMSLLIQKMSLQNRFHALSSSTFHNWHIGPKDQRAFVNKVRNLPTPVVFDRHVHSVNFSRFGAVQPVLINVIRDPIMRLTSEYYYFHKARLRKLSRLKYSKFTAWAKRYGDIGIAPRNQNYDECVMKQRPGCNRSTDFFIIIPFFCGQEDFCLKPSADSLARAKYNVINNYLLVGILEEIGSFIEGLEILLPRFFKGAGSQKLKNTNAATKKAVQNKTADLLRSKLREEYDFYHFVKQQFYKTMASLKITE